MSATNRDVIVFLAHRFNREIERRFLKLQQECATTCDVVVFAESDTVVPENLRPFAHFFNFPTVRRVAKSIIGDSIVPGNAHLRAIEYFRRFPHYRYYWFVEYDVVYTGDWGLFINSLAEDESDLLAAHIRTIADEPDWYWRRSLFTGAALLPDEGFLMAFLPIHRISARALEAVESKVRDGWVGHFEALVPSVVADAGMSLSDLGGSGSWTPNDRIHRHYLAWPGPYNGGTLRHRPPFKWPVIKNMLYHPCKTDITQGLEVPPSPHVDVVVPRKDPRVLVPYWLKTIQLVVLSRLRGQRR